MEASALREAISGRLEAGGFALDHAEIGGLEAVIARRAQFHWTLTRLHIFVFLFETSNLNQDEAVKLTDAARAFATANKGGLPAGLQTGSLAMPVFIADGDAGAAKEWAWTGRPKKHWGVFEWPIVIETGTGDVAYCDDRGLWGAAYVPTARRIVEEHVVGAVPDRPRAEPREVGPRYVGVGRRALALAVDVTLWWIPYSIATGGYTSDENSIFFTVEGNDFWVLQVLLLAYFTAAEGLLGATVGKWALGVRVRDVDGAAIGLRAAAIRNVLRVVDAFPYLIPYLVGAIAVWKNDKRQRYGDRAARTVVVRR